MVYSCVATCLMGIESMVKNELKLLGASEIKAENARVFFTADANILARSLLCCRFAERILLHVGTFKAHNFEELFQGVKSLDWENYIGKFDAFPIKGNTVASKLESVKSCRSIIKKAVAKRLGEKYGVSWFEQTGNMKLIKFTLIKDQISLMIDLCGEALHKRKYRENFTKAPIKETLAAAMIDFIRVYDDSVLIDPFCGSGTIVIEGAMKALNIAPGLNRNFTVQSWDEISVKIWKEEKERAISLQKNNKSFKAFAYDIDDYSLKLAQENAKRAGVDKYIEFINRDIRNFSCKHNKTVVVTNPPYGQRLIDKNEARNLYKIMGEVFRHDAIERMCIISPDDAFENIFGQKAKKTRKLYNGMIRCNAYAYF